jgi:hypothetical protein
MGPVSRSQGIANLNIQRRESQSRSWPTCGLITSTARATTCSGPQEHHEWPLRAPLERASTTARVGTRSDTLLRR